jgi:exosortase
MSPRVRTIASVTIIALPFLALYSAVFSRLMQDWLHDDNYSHGFLILPVAMYFVWERRQRLMTLQRRPHAFGLVIVLLSSAMVVGGTLGAELFTTRIALLGTIVGSVIFLCGWSHLQLLAFPIGFLLLMIPLPTIIFNQIAFPLQLTASKLGEVTLAAVGIPVVREGNVIYLAHSTLEVAEACSGIRSLVSLLTFGIIYGYFTDRRTTVRLAIACSTVPVAIAANGLRVAGTGIAAHFYGEAAATGFLHTFSGLLMFAASLAILSLTTRLVRWITPQPALAGALPRPEYLFEP